MDELKRNQPRRKHVRKGIDNDLVLLWMKVLEAGELVLRFPTQTVANRYRYRLYDTREHMPAYEDRLRAYAIYVSKSGDEWELAIINQNSQLHHALERAGVVLKAPELKDEDIDI